MSSAFNSKPAVMMGRVPKADADSAATVTEVHSIPCKTAYTGPAPVEGYLMREKREGEEMYSSGVVWLELLLEFL